MTINIGFQTLDYCIFGISLLISVVVGLYNAFKGKKIDRSASSSTAVVGKSICIFVASITYIDVKNTFHALALGITYEYVRCLVFISVA